MNWIKSKRLLIISFGIFAIAALFVIKGGKSLAANPNVDINLSEEYQEIKGFGGINIPEWVGSDMTDEQRQTAFGNGDNELGFNILRIFVNDDPNQWQKAVPTAKYAQEQGALVFASPWNPPSSMTTNSNGKRLSHDKYDAYVEHLNDFVKFMADNGVDLYAISIQNEPDYAHDWTAWSEDEILNFMKNYAGKINCRVMSPESFQYRKNIYDVILNDEEALANMDILGTHFYGTQYRDFDYPLFRQKGQGKELWMTEVYYPNSDKDSNENWDQALQLSQHISNSLTDANMQAYVWWYIRRNYGPMNEDGSISKRGYVMAQFSKYARQGYIRVGATKNPTNDIYVSAYKGDGNKLTVVAINMSKNENSQSFSINESKIAKVVGYRTSRSENLANVSNINVDNRSFSAILPAESVTTFVLTLGDNVTTNDNQSNNENNVPNVDDNQNNDSSNTDNNQNDNTSEEDTSNTFENIVDINGDGKICILDVFEMQRGIKNGFKNDDIKSKADINKDGEVNDSDVTIMLKYIVSIEEKVEPSDNSNNDKGNSANNQNDGNASNENSSSNSEGIVEDSKETSYNEEEMKNIFANVKAGSSLKKLGENNTLITQYFGADPGVLVYGDRVYIYMTDDHLVYNGNSVAENTYSDINKLRCISSSDLVNWTDHGLINVAGNNGIAKWAGCSWAPTACYKKINGKDKFFLYFANNANGIGVLTSDSPVGPWKDEVGQSLVSRSTANCSDVTWLFDPAVLVDDDGTGYLYFGGGIPEVNGAKQNQNPNTARVVKLGDDMISLAGNPEKIDAPYLFEDSGINKIGNKYYYSYCSNFNTSGNQYGITGGAIEYMVSDSPMGPFTYAGEFFKNVGNFFGTYGNNHHTIFEFKDKYYLAYHTQVLQDNMGVKGGYRSTNIDELEIGSDGTIKELKGTMSGAKQVGNINGFGKNQAETIYRQSGIEIEGTSNTVVSGVSAGDWIGVKGVKMSKAPSEITVNVSSNKDTAIKICKESENGTVVGYISVPSTNGEFMNISSKISGLEGTEDIYFVFADEMKMDYWYFK